MTQTFRSKTVLLSVPAYAAASLLGAQLGGPALVKEAELLNKIQYPSVAAVTLAYPTSAFRVSCRDCRAFPGHCIATLICYLLPCYHSASWTASDI